MPIIGVPIVSPSGDHFTTRAAATDFMGSANAAVYADKDGDGDIGAIDDAWEAALSDTDNEIIAAFRHRLREAGVDAWATSDLVPGDVDDAVDSAWLDETARWGTTVRLYGGRGQADDGSSAGPSPDGKMQTLWQRYQDRLTAIREGDALAASAFAVGVTLGEEWGELLSPTAVYPTVDKDGLAQTASNVATLYRGPRWDSNLRAYRW